MPATHTHPLDPLTPAEISDVSRAVRLYASGSVASQDGGEKSTPANGSSATETIHKLKALKFIHAALQLPPKRDVLAFLGIDTDRSWHDGAATKAGAEPSSHPMPARQAEVDVIDPVTGSSYHAVLTLASGSAEPGKWKVTTFERLPETVHPQLTVEELIQADEAVRTDPEIIKVAAEIGLKPEQLCADGWSIGYDDRFPASQRVQQCLMYARLEDQDNLYAHPLDFFPVVDSNTFKVIHIDFAPQRLSPTNTLSSPSTSPPRFDPIDSKIPDNSTQSNAKSIAKSIVHNTVDSSLQSSNRPRIPPPLQTYEYLPERLGVDLPLRIDVKPLHIIQPHGASFRMIGESELEWQKWRMHIAFTGREGIVISTITYNDGGEIRPLFYRLNLAEMVVPYAAPEHPHPRKFAFDVGEYGMGTQANDLSLGCDCLGTIHYLPGSYIGHNGEPVTIKRAICIHEEDHGLLWKHTDFRPGGRAHSVRSRRLSISMVCTVANYEYILYFHFYQDGSIQFDTRLTGILNTYVQALNEMTSPFATTVAPQISAQYHQHIFSLRIDPMLDGLHNSVVESDIIPLPHPTGSAENYAGNGFTLTETTLKIEGEGGREYDAVKDRRWTIINPRRKHYASGRSVGYTIGSKGAMVKLLAKDDSWAARRASFATKTMWVVRDTSEDGMGRLYPAGRYVPQTRDAPEDSVGVWAKGEKSIEDTDIVIFFTLGITHIPRPEDWPVMPVERLEVNIKPSGFFKFNPSLDVPGAVDEQSVETGSAHCHA